jgi:hypothetical protein
MAPMLSVSWRIFMGRLTKVGLAGLLEQGGGNFESRVAHTIPSWSL